MSTTNLKSVINFDTRFFISILFLSFIFVISTKALTSGNNSYISNEKKDGAFTISESGKSSPMYVALEDYPGVVHFAKLLQTDIKNVTNSEPTLSVLSSTNNQIFKDNEIIIAGTIGKNYLIEDLIKNNKLDIKGIEGKWETFVIQVIDNPFPNVSRALVIAGSDKRGTIYGMLDLSEKIGVSPWYWWADVPVKKNDNVYILHGRYSLGEPKVKYRGIFINDEAPALTGWAEEKFGTQMFNHEFYDHVFELILRLKGNFLWPAMWGKAFYDDDSLNSKLASEYGIVVGTSHHEPMMRAHDEWRRFGSGPWNYATNEKTLKDFWRKGIERMDDNESIITLAMRGDGDEAMSQDANVSLLEKIVNDQRELIKEVTKKDIESIPQVWALYKEVQEYYDKGMRVPDDVTLLLCDDNWGNLRKLPSLNDKPRKGGYGIYYHFDYVGGPRNYKWLNTVQIERTWEQMRLAYEYGVDKIWIVNVGDIKPMEFPITFFLDYAWNPDNYTEKSLPGFYKNWAEEQFGKENADEIGEIIALYTKYNSRRKPELLSPDTYNITNYNEAETVVNDYNKLTIKAQQIYSSLPEEYKDAFYQLVLYPVIACANLNELYVTAAKNYLYAKQKRVQTNSLAQKVKDLFNKDSEFTYYYNKIMTNGKWNHMMDQTHIGYTYWQQPDSNSMPEVVKIENLNEAKMGVAVEGSEEYFPVIQSLTLSEFNKCDDQSYYIEIFNQGKIPFDFKISKNETWIKITNTSGQVIDEGRFYVNIDWDKICSDKNIGMLSITSSNGETATISIIANVCQDKEKTKNYFVETKGYVSIEAPHYSKTVESENVKWQIIPNLGRTFSAVTPIPVTSPEISLNNNSPHLEYQILFTTEGEVNVKTFFSPTLNFNDRENGIQFAVSFDDQEPQLVNMTSNPNPPDLNLDSVWNKWVSDNINIQSIKLNIEKLGLHTLKIWMIDPGIVLQKIVIDCGGLKPSYLGPPESPRFQ